jgi:hypothetical protein
MTSHFAILKRVRHENWEERREKKEDNKKKKIGSLKPN